MYETHYHRASSVDDAAAQFAKGSEAKYLSGGQTLLPVMKQRLAAPSDVIDLAKIPALIGIEVGGDNVTAPSAARSPTTIRRRTIRRRCWRSTPQ